MTAGEYRPRVAFLGYAHDARGLTRDLRLPTAKITVPWEPWA